MEGTNLPPPQPYSPQIGESSKVRSTLDLLNLTKMLALIIGIVSFLIALWQAIDMIVWMYVYAAIWAIYWIISGVVNFMVYSKIPTYDSMIRARRYTEAKQDMMTWAIVALIFGVVAGILLLIIIFVNLEELERMHPYAPQYPSPPQAPPPPQ